VKRSLLLAAVVFCEPIAAQPVIEGSASRIVRQWVDTHEDVRKPLSEFASCTVRGDLKRSRELVVDTDYGISARYSDLLSNYCLPADRDLYLGMTPTVVRFALADAVFARSLRDIDPKALAAAPALPGFGFNKASYDQDGAKIKAASERDAWMKNGQTIARDLEYFRFGECLVRGDPAAARSLLLTKIESKEEASAFAGLIPTLDRCQSARRQVSLDKADVRGTVAVNYVRLASVAQSGASSNGVRR